MKRQTYFELRLILLIILLAAISGCGGGGGGSSSSPAASPNSKASFKTVKLLPAGTVYGGIKLTLNFSQGVTVPLADAATGTPTAEAVKLIGATDPNLKIAAKFTAATAVPLSGKLTFIILEPNGFTSSGNEYIELQFDVIPGFRPVAADFGLSDFVVTDLATSTDTPLTPPAFEVEVI